MMNQKNGNTGGRQQGLTIMEITMVLALMIAISSLVFYSLGGMENWKKAKTAGEQLREVYVAQKTYLADHPTEKVADLNEAKLLPYLPNGATAIGKVETKEGSMISISVDVMPPVAMGDSGPYDPSGAADDGLWDVGKH